MERKTQRERVWGRHNKGKNMRDFTIFYSTPEALNKNIVQEL